MTAKPLPLVYLDECVGVYIVDPLRHRGYRMVTATDAGMNGADDSDQLAYAAAREMVIISHNGIHFRRLHAQFRAAGRAHVAIIILPQRSHRAQLALRAAMMLDWLVSLRSHRSIFARWGDLHQLLLRGLRLAGYDEAEVHLAMGQ